MVYIIGQDGKPLMPTERYGKVRRLLKTGKAIVVNRCPFTIQLQYPTETEATQPISLGVDAGSRRIGLSATTKKKVLFESDVIIRNDIVGLISTRSELRRARRNRKTRYRKARFKNRPLAKGWLSPAIRHKIDCHMAVIDRVHRILPITKIVAEVASFDIQKIKNPEISGVEYQRGEQLGFWNVREYVLFRDKHKCQCCKGRSGDRILNVHHIESRKTGGNAPNNLVTLCETCHKAWHRGEINLPKTIKRGGSFRDHAFMGIMRWNFYNKLKRLYKDVSLTYGYVTKNMRIVFRLDKPHCADARCVSGNPLAVSDGTIFFQKKIRCHNRRIHKCTIHKGGGRKRNQAEYVVKGFRLFDKVKYNNQECFIYARRVRGTFSISNLSGTIRISDINYKKLRFLETRRNYLIERINEDALPD